MEDIDIELIRKLDKEAKKIEKEFSEKVEKLNKKLGFSRYSARIFIYFPCD